MTGVKTEDRQATHPLQHDEVLRAASDLRRAVLPNDLLRQLRGPFALRQITVATACGTSDRAVRLWEHGGSMRTRHADQLVNLVDTVLILSDTLIPNGFDQWLWTKNRSLDGLRPVNALADGNEVDVKRAAHAFVRGDLV